MDIGSLAPFDLVIILCIMLIAASVGVVLYRSMLRWWLRRMRFPSILRFWAISTAVALIAFSLYWFLFDESMLISGIIVLAFSIYSAVLFFWAKRAQ